LAFKKKLEEQKRTVVQKCIEMNRLMRAHAPTDDMSKKVSKASLTEVTNLKNASRVLNSTVFRDVVERLYAIPEIAICVDFWNGAMKSKSITVESLSDEVPPKFRTAFNKYFSDYEQVDDKSLTDLLNENIRDYLFHGMETFWYSPTFTEIDGFKFPKSIIPVKYKDSNLRVEDKDIRGVTYSMSPFQDTIKSSQVLVCKRMGTIHDEIGIPFMARALSPVSTMMVDSELDTSIAKLGIMSSFVLIKYGTNDDPRSEEELNELYEELRKNIQMGVGFGVVPPDVNVDSLFKAYGASSFNRDKIYETYLRSIDLAFGGVITLVSPKANLGSASDNVVVTLQNLISQERNDRKSKIMDVIARRVAKANGILEVPEVTLSDVEFSLNVTQENRLKEYDRGIISYKTYVGDKYSMERSRLIDEQENDRGLVKPRQLPYNQPSGGSDDQKDTEPKENVDE